MNTTTKQDQKKNQQQKTRQKHGPNKPAQNSNMLHGGRKQEDHEHAETRMTR